MVFDEATSYDFILASQPLRFVAVVLLGNKGEQVSNLLASFATCLCWQRSGHE